MSVHPISRPAARRSLACDPDVEARCAADGQVWRDRGAALEEFAALAVDDPHRAVARARVIEAWLGWAHRYAHRYAGRGLPSDDLRPVAALALVKAVDGYDPARGDCFAAYAAPTIVGELKRHFRDCGWAVRIPRRLQELVLGIGAARETLQQRSGRSPTVEELAVELGAEPPDIIAQDEK